MSTSGSERTAAVPPQRRWRAWLTGGGGACTAFAWGWAEAMLFFVVADVLFTLTAAFDFRAAMRQVTMALAGALVGGALMYQWASHQPATARNAVLRVPFVTEAMAAEVRNHFGESGAAGMVRVQLTGIPYKLYAVEAPSHAGFGSFLLWSIPARVARFAPGLIGAGAIGWILRRLFPGRVTLVFIAHATCWIVIYAVYWARV